MGFTRKAAKRSPVKPKPLHSPGESVQQEIDSLVDDKILSYLLGGTLMLVLAFAEWVRWFRPYPPQPIPMTVFAILFAGYCIFRVIRYRRKIRALRLGLEGEKAVGQFLTPGRSRSVP